MRTGSAYDAVIVGSGPNGLAAAICLAKEGQSVLVLEAKDSIGGGARSAELTLPGFVHDVCSAIHPMAVASPFLRSLPLANHGLQWIFPPVALAHPFDDGSAALLLPSIERTTGTLGLDAVAWRELMQLLVTHWKELLDDVLAPLHVPRHPCLLGRFGWNSIRSANALTRGHFKGPRARGLFAGLAAHSMLPLESVASASFGLVLGCMGHAVNWPVAAGGSQAISNALGGYLR